jgi:hypothetical protein
MCSFWKCFVLDYYSKRSLFLLFCFFISDWQGIYLSGCSLASHLLGSFPAAWVYAAAAATMPDAAPLKEQDLVSIVASWYVGSRAVMYSPLCPAYDRKFAILMSAALTTMQCAGSSSSLVSESAPPSGPRRQRPFGELATFSWYLDILASCIR